MLTANTNHICVRIETFLVMTSSGCAFSNETNFKFSVTYLASYG